MDTGKNRYDRRSRIAEPTFRRLIKAFAMDLTANDAAERTGLSVRSANAIYLKIRRRIAEACEAQSPFQGEGETDESYFGPKRVRGPRGRGAGGKTIVFGVLKRGDQAYPPVVPDVKKTTLRKAIRGKVDLDTIVHSDHQPRRRSPRSKHGTCRGYETGGYSTAVLLLVPVVAGSAPAFGGASEGAAIEDHGGGIGLPCHSEG